jgi:hypothetical protein
MQMKPVPHPAGGDIDVLAYALKSSPDAVEMDPDREVGVHSFASAVGITAPGEAVDVFGHKHVLGFGSRPAKAALCEMPPARAYDPADQHPARPQRMAKLRCRRRVIGDDGRQDPEEAGAQYPDQKVRGPNPSRAHLGARGLR